MEEGRTRKQVEAVLKTLNYSEIDLPRLRNGLLDGYAALRAALKQMTTECDDLHKELLEWEKDQCPECGESHVCGSKQQLAAMTAERDEAIRRCNEEYAAVQRVLAELAQAQARILALEQDIKEWHQSDDMRNT